MPGARVHTDGPCDNAPSCTAVAREHTGLHFHRDSTQAGPGPRGPLRRPTFSARRAWPHARSQARIPSTGSTGDMWMSLFSRNVGDIHTVCPTRLQISEEEV